ncbi:MAG: helix-turn-helix domain-containing protein [bacterium]|nr:helix-turn-helix domain-containing protein [bacterium]
MTTDREPSLMTAKEVADCLGLHESRVYRLSQRGLIPACRVGGSWRFQRDEIKKWWLARQVRSKRAVL